MLLEPSERVEHPDEVAAAIQRLVNSGNSVVIVAERSSRLVGYIEATDSVGSHRWAGAPRGKEHNPAGKRVLFPGTSRLDLVAVTAVPDA